MSTFRFARASYTQLWLKIRSDETLGILDSDYLEDYNGVDGQITLHHVATVTDYTVLMSHVPGETPTIPFDVFQGVYSPLADLPDGIYELRFRCRDVMGNYTIVNSVQNPFGGERILSLNLEIVPFLFGYIYQEGSVIARGGITIDLRRGTLNADVSRVPVAENVGRVQLIASVQRVVPDADVRRTSIYTELT